MSLFTISLHWCPRLKHLVISTSIENVFQNFKVKVYLHELLAYDRLMFRRQLLNYTVALDVPTFLVHNRSSVSFYRKENMKTKILLAQNSQFSILFNYELSVKLNKVSRRQNTRFQNIYLLESEQIIGPLNLWIQELLSYFACFEYKQTERKITEGFNIWTS